MDNPILLKTISVLAFVVSAIFTILLMTSGTVGVLAFILTCLMAVVLEMCKVGFFYESLINRKINQGIRILLGTISVFLVIASIIASSSYIQNQANLTNNIKVRHSTQYNQLEEGRTLKVDLHNQKQLELERLRTSQQKTLDEMRKIRDSYPANYITVKQNATREINQVDADFNNRISQVLQEVESLSSDLQSPIDTSNLKIADTQGYNSMFTLIANKLNSSHGSTRQYTANELMLYFFIILSVIFETTAVLTAYLSKIKQKGNVVDTTFQQDSNKVIEIKKDAYANPKTTVAEDKSKKIGFQYSQSNNIQKKDIERYIEYMYDNSKGNESIGYMKIGKNTLLGVEKARKIKGYLENMDILKTEGVKTKILKPKDEVLKLV